MAPRKIIGCLRHTYDQSSPYARVPTSPSVSTKKTQVTASPVNNDGTLGGFPGESPWAPLPSGGALQRGLTSHRSPKTTHGGFWAYLGCTPYRTLTPPGVVGRVFPYKDNGYAAHTLEY